MTSTSAVDEETAGLLVVAVVSRGTCKLICCGEAKKSGADTPLMRTSVPASLVGSGCDDATSDPPFVIAVPKRAEISPGTSVALKLAAEDAATTRDVV